MKKKILVTSLTAALTVSAISPSFTFAKENNAASVKVNEAKEVTEVTQNEMINTIKPYVHLNEDGTIGLKDVPQDIYNAYNLEELQKHFDTINIGVQNGTLAVDENLNITELGFSTMAAVYGEWTYHWWGYDRKFTNSQTKTYVDRLEYQAIGATMVTGVGAWFPPVAGIAGVSAGYWALLAKRVEANNNGKGVYVGVTWVNIFNVEPL